MVRESFLEQLLKKIRLCFFYNNHFCVIWKSQGVSFNQAINELKDNFKIVDKYLTEENVKSNFEYIYKPKKN